MAWQVKKPGKHQEYILKADRESSEPTRFTLRALTWEEAAEVGEIMPMTMEQAMQVNAIVEAAKAEDRELSEDENKRIVEITKFENVSIKDITRQHAIAVRYGVVKIAGLLDSDGQPLSMSGSEFAKFAQMEAIIELGKEILRISRHSDDTIKK